jgi:hypothetical protein
MRCKWASYVQRIEIPFKKEDGYEESTLDDIPGPATTDDWEPSPLDIQRARQVCICEEDG